MSDSSGKLKISLLMIPINMISIIIGILVGIMYPGNFSIRALQDQLSTFDILFIIIISFLANVLVFITNRRMTNRPRKIGK